MKTENIKKSFTNGGGKFTLTTCGFGINSTALAVAGGSFALSFIFIGGIVPLDGASARLLLFAAWACFALCLIALAAGNLISAEAWRKQRDQVAAGMALKMTGGKPMQVNAADSVSPCNYIALASCAGGIVCLLLFVLSNLR